MFIRSIHHDPLLEIRFLNAGKGPGSFYVDRLPVLTAEVDGLPGELDAIVATADLQGRERLQEARGGPPRLLGEVLPQRLAEMILPELGIRAERTAAVLAGDFYTVPGLDKRGGSGDVTSVWQAFGRHFRWAAGVAGNHDTFGDSAHPSTGLGRNLHYLDQGGTTVDGLRIGGVGGVIGHPRRLHRRSEDEFLECLERVLQQRTDLLIMHDGPNVPDASLRGSEMIRLTLERHRPCLVVRGHAHWPQPLVELAGGTQVLNVDCRVVILRRSEPT